MASEESEKSAPRQPGENAGAKKPQGSDPTSQGGGSSQQARPFSQPSPAAAKDGGQEANRSGSDRREPGSTSSPTVGSTGVPEVPPTPITQQIGRAVVILAAAAFGVFAVANAQPVEFSWLFGETRVVLDEEGQRVAGGIPLIVLLVTSLAIGIAVGLFIAWQRNRLRRRKDS